MKRKNVLVKMLSIAMAIVMLVGAVPLSLFNFDKIFSVEANAATQYSLYWPVPTSSAAIGKYSSAFGPRKSPTAGASSNHRGIDIPVASGTAVYAAYDGVVVAIGKTNARGNYVLLYHSAIGLSTLYQHLTCATVQKGDTVTGGSQIALSGNTGIGTGAHLHYGVMVGKATKVDNDQPSYNMAINPLGSNISYTSSSGKVVSSDNPDDYTYPTRDLFYTSPVKTGSDVKWVQAVLWKLGYDISIDGSFGPATRDAIKQFQSDYGLDVDGSCGPTTRSKLLEQWNKKKNGDISITLHAWLSNEEYGEAPDEYIVRDDFYLCYELVDSNTWQKINGIVDKNYTTTLTFYDTNGNAINSDPLQNRDESWFKITPLRAGNWKAKVVVSGDVNREVNLSVNVKYSASITPSKNSVNLNLNGTNESTISFAPTGGYPGNWGMAAYYDTTVVEVTNSYKSNGIMYVDLRGLKRGTTEFKVDLFEQYSGNSEVVASIVIPVTVTANSYTISYNANGGSGAPSSQTKYYGTDITLSSTRPTRSGYTFLGWSTSSTATSATYQPGATFSSNANTPLYAVWKANTYTVKYNANGGSGTMSNSSHTYDVSKSLTSNAFTRSGYTFLGWSTSSTATSATYTNGQSVKNLTTTDGATVNLYAVWSANETYTLSYNANGGTNAPSGQSGSVSYTISSTVPTKFGYTFLGWSKSSSATTATYIPGSTITLTSDTTLYAVWKSATTLSQNTSYSATVNFAGQENYYTFKPSTSGPYVIYSTDDEDTRVYLYNSSGTELKNDDDGGEDSNFRLQYDLTAGTTYYFKVRYYNSSKTGTITFKFGKVYTVDYYANGGIVAPLSQTKDYGTALTLSSTTSTRTGYTFLGWSTSSTATSATYTAGGTYSSESDATLYAVWKANTYSVKYNANGGSGTMSNSTHTYGESKALASNVFTRTGYTFVGWSLSSDATTVTYTNGQSVMNLTSINGDTVTLYAVWSNTDILPPTISVSSTNNIASSQTVTLTMVDNIGVVSYYWGINSNPEDSSFTAITSTVSKTVEKTVSDSGTYYLIAKNAAGKTTTTSVTFYKTILSKSISSNVSTQQDIITKSGNTITLPTPTRDGYTFKGWATSGTATSGITTLTVSENKTYFSIWKYNNFHISISVTNDVSSSQTVTLTMTDNLLISGYYWGTNSSVSGYAPVTGSPISYTTTKTVSDSGTYYLIVWDKEENKEITSVTLFKTTLDANGGSVTPTSVLTKSGNTIILPTPTRIGYDFLGWSTSSTATSATYQPGSNFTTNADTTLYAVWRANTYTIKYNANGGSGTMSDSSHTYDVSKSLTSNAFTRSGYTFLGWSTSSSATTATYTNGQSIKNLTTIDGGTVNLYAVWSLIPTYAVSYNANGGSNAPSSQTKIKDVTLTLSSTKPTRTGYMFLGWSTSSTATTATYQPGSNFTTNANTTLYAVWRANTYTIKYNANGGSGTMSDSSHTYDVSKSLTLNAFTRSGYTFLGWSTSSTATSATYTNGQSVKNLTTTDGATVTLYAVWEKVESDVLIGDVNDDGCVDAGDAVVISRYDAGIITLTAEQLVAGDVNDDGYVDAGDAVIISRYDAGLISSLH